MAQHIEIGAIVRITAPGSRESEGEARTIPAIVTHQWPDGSLQLYCFHFQGSPLLQNAVRPDRVEVLMGRTEFESIQRRLTDLEKQVASSTGWKPGANEPRFALAHDAG